MSFENWNRFLQTTIAELNKDKAETKPTKTRKRSPGTTNKNTNRKSKHKGQAH